MAANKTSGGAGKVKGGFMGCASIAIILVLCVFGIVWYVSDDDEPVEASPGASAPASPARDTKATPSRQAQTTCPPFSAAGATCEIAGGTCSGWIRMASPSLAGKAFEWGPWPASKEDFRVMYRSVRYSDSQGNHEWEPGVFAEGALSWDFCPIETMTLTYAMAEPTPR